MAKTQMYRNDVLAGEQINLYPVTEAKYVTMNDGQSVEEMMSSVDANKYTPTIENSSSMFKVGQGDSVDLSSSVKEGAYNSCVLKGVTKYIDNDTNEILDQFEEGRNLSLIDCKSPILSNIGKNLFNINGEINEKFSNIFANDAPNTVDGNTIIASSWTGNHHGKGQKIKVKRGKLYTCSFTTSDNGNVIIHTPKKVNFTSIKSSTFTFTAPTDCDEIVVAFNTYGASSGGKIHNLCVIEGDVTSVEYEPYKSNTTTFEQKDDKTIVLRSLPNDVCDTLNVETGEYVQRIGEVVLDGSDSTHVWNLNGDWSMGDVAVFWLSNIVKMTGNSILCDKFPSLHKNELILNNVATKEAIRYGVTSVQIFIAKNKLATPDVAGFKQWLSQNPIVVQYELETPTVKTIDIQGFPYAYKDGHVQLSSGSIEQSLTPKVEYSLVANKSGQIDNNTKMTIRHDKQINDFESVMLVSLLESSYQKTLMKFNFDMRMTSLGGEE